MHVIGPIPGNHFSGINEILGPIARKIRISDWNGYNDPAGSTIATGSTESIGFATTRYKLAAFVLADGRRIETLIFLSDTDHPQWAGALSLERQAEHMTRMAETFQKRAAATKAFYAALEKASGEPVQMGTASPGAPG